MTLSLVSTTAGSRNGRLLAGAALLLLTLIVPLASGHADDDAFSATVRVDATADDTPKARDKARIDGQRSALAAVVQRLSGTADLSKLAKLDDKTITDMVVSFDVAGEHMTAVRYVADYTYHFRAGDVRRVLRDAGIAFAEGAGKPVVVLPLYQADGKTVLWADPNPWRQAWAQRPTGSGLVRLAVPLGDAGDVAAIDGERALAADTGALTAVTRKNGGDEAIVALATARRQGDEPVGIDVTVKRYRFGQLVDTATKGFDANPGEAAGDLLRRAADATAADIESGWSKSNVLRYDQQGSLTATVAIAGLDDWVRTRDRLAAVTAIRKVDLMSLSRQEAQVEIYYVGAVDQLKTSLAEAGLDLVGGDPLWRLARPGATTAR